MSKGVDIQPYIDAKKPIFATKPIIAHPTVVEAQKRRTREIRELIDSHFVDPGGS